MGRRRPEDASAVGGASRALLLLLAIGCGREQPSRDELNKRLASRSVKERAQALQHLEGASADSWTLLLKSARDGSPVVRAEAAQAMARSKRADAADAISPLLRDPEDTVRLAAASALGELCGERAPAYLRMAFERSDAAAREKIAEALQKCGASLPDTLQREETERRRKALQALGSTNAAQRAHGARELGLLGRDEDRAKLEKLLDDPDGVVVAAAARGLAACEDVAAAPRIAKLLEERGEVAQAAAESLAVLHAENAYRPALLKVAIAAGDEAVAAARATGADCQTALVARDPRAVSLLAEDCPAAKFPADDYAALLVAKPPAPQLEKPLSAALNGGRRDPVLAQLAGRYSVAGDALVKALQEIAKTRKQPAPKAQPEIAEAGSAGEPDRYRELMQKLEARQQKKERARNAAERLSALLAGEPQAEERDFIVAALEAARAQHAKNFHAVAGQLASDPDPIVAAAARGDPVKPPAPRAEKALSLWSEDGAVRAKACRAGSESAAVKAAFASSDPERRVRTACASNETAPGK
jgi:hypothetical protein